MEINLVTLLEMILQSLSPREASAKVTADPYAQTTIKDIQSNPSQDYLPRQYRRIVEKAASAPENVHVLPDSALLQSLGASAGYDPQEQHIYYNKDVTRTAKNLQNPLVHELVHHLAIYGKEPQVPSPDEQHRLIKMFLGTNLYEPADTLRGYVPRRGNLKDLEAFEKMITPAQKYYRTR